MKRSTLKDTLEISTNIAVLLVALVILSAITIGLFRKSSTPNLTPGLEKGRVFGTVPKVDYRASEQTLLIALNTNCSYCRESLPLYLKLLESHPQASKSLRIFALFPNSAAEVAKYQKDNQLPVDAVADVDFGSLRVSGTPTMILVNSNGEVKDFWIGKLGDHEADEFVRALDRR